MDTVESYIPLLRRASCTLLVSLTFMLSASCGGGGSGGSGGTSGISGSVDVDSGSDDSGSGGSGGGQVETSPGPSVTSVTPTTITADTSSTFTISGQFFQSGNIAATLGNDDCTVTISSSTRASAICQGQDAGSVVNLLVKNANGVTLRSTSITVRQIVIKQLDVAQVISMPTDGRYQTLTPNRAALVRAYVYSNESPDVTITTNGSTTNMNCPASFPSTLPSDATIRSYNKADHCYSTLSASEVRSDLSFTVAAGTQRQSADPDVASKSTINIKVVPITINGRTSTVPSLSEIASRIKSRMPFATINVTQRAAWAPNGTFDDNLVGTNNVCLPGTTVDTNGDFGCVLQQLNTLRTSEVGSNTGDSPLYYGLVPYAGNLDSSSIIIGLGYLASGTGFNSFSSIGFEGSLSQNANYTNFRWYITMLHEIGHNLSLQHAPCGIDATADAGSIDSFWYTQPWANASGGKLSSAALYDQENDTFIDPATTGLQTVDKGSDIMGYCVGEWFSEYNYHKIASYAAGMSVVVAGMNSPQVAAMASNPAPTQVLRISGSIYQDKATLLPIQKGISSSVTPDAGEYSLLLKTTTGKIIKRRFNAAQIADGKANSASINLIVPDPGILAGIEILRDGQSIYRKLTAGSKVSALRNGGGANLNVSEREGMLHVTWNQRSYPWLQLVHVANDGTRTALALHAQGGKIKLPLVGLTSGGNWEISLSDGINSSLRVLDRK